MIARPVVQKFATDARKSLQFTVGQGGGEIEFELFDRILLGEGIGIAFAREFVGGREGGGGGLIVVERDGAGPRVEVRLVDQILRMPTNGARIAWLTSGKAARRFIGSLFRRRQVLTPTDFAAD